MPAQPPKTFRTPEALGRDPEFIKSWTTNPAIVNTLLELEARHDRHKARELCPPEAGCPKCHRARQTTPTTAA